MLLPVEKSQQHIGQPVRVVYPCSAPAATDSLLNLAGKSVISRYHLTRINISWNVYYIHVP